MYFLKAITIILPLPEEQRCDIIAVARTVSDQVSVAGSAAAPVVVVSHIEGECCLKLYLQSTTGDSDHHYYDTAYSQFL